MKYRSYNSEIIIATSLIINVFNDIIIDRRKQGLNKDYSKPLSLDDIVQQKIEIPCILGDRSAILKSLENEPGRYKLPLIILQMKSLKTDTNRMADLHADVFYQKDSSFNKLNVNNDLYRPYDLSKKRGQPVIIDYDMTIITKYKEDMDQILSNWIVHFRPDIYFKWWHPKVKYEPLTSQLIWNHNIGFDSPVEYNPQNVFTYKSSTTFLFKTWLFYGMESSFIDDTGEGIIKSFKLFPNKSSKYHQDENESNPRIDNMDELDVYIFGEIIKTNNAEINFWNVNFDQQFIDNTNDVEGKKNGKYVVNNVFSINDKDLSGNLYSVNYRNCSDNRRYFNKL